MSKITRLRLQLRLQRPEDDEEIQEVFLCVDEEKKLELEAKKEEIENLQKHNVFEEIDASDVQQPLIGTRWVITDKSKNGIAKKKARLVAKGFQEKHDNLRADSPTCLKETLRLVITIAAAKKWDVCTLDFKSAFLQGKEIERAIFLIPPPEIKSGVVWKLKKTIYGLSDASRMWY